MKRLLYSAVRSAKGANVPLYSWSIHKPMVVTGEIEKGQFDVTRQKTRRTDEE